MNEAEDNEAKLAACHERAPKKLFSSAQILEVLETTPSVKTKLELVKTLLAPRCADPRDAASAVTAVFRFTAEKQAVQGALHSRERVVNSRKGPGVRGGRSLHACSARSR